MVAKHRFICTIYPLLFLYAEKGQFLTLDLWGNHFRVLLVTIDGNEPVDVESSQGLIPTKVVDGTGEAVSITTCMMPQLA